MSLGTYHLAIAVTLWHRSAPALQDLSRPREGSSTVLHGGIWRLTAFNMCFCLGNNAVDILHDGVLHLGLHSLRRSTFAPLRQ